MNKVRHTIQEPFALTLNERDPSWHEVNEDRPFFF